MKKHCFLLASYFCNRHLYILLPNKNSIPSKASCYALPPILFRQNLTTLKPHLGIQEIRQGQGWGKVQGRGEPEEWDEEACSTTSLVRRNTKKFNSLFLSCIKMKNSLVQAQVGWTAFLITRLGTGSSPHSHIYEPGWSHTVDISWRWL